MHDIRMIRDNPAAFDAALSRRGMDAMSSEILAIDTARRAKIAASEAALAERNVASKQVGAAKAKGDDIVKAVCADMKSERFKNRVTFYYLCAKKAGKLSVFN